MADLAINQLPNYSGAIAGTNFFPITQGGSPTAAVKSPISALVPYLEGTSSFILSAPSADQTISSNNLTLSSGNLTLSSGILTVSDMGASPCVNIIGNDTGNVYNQLNIASIVNPNYHITLGVDSAAGLGGTFAGDAGTGFIPYCLQVLGGSYVGVGSNGNQSELRVFPLTANNGFLRLLGSNSVTNNASTITNSNVAQDTKYILSDPGVISTSFILADNAGTQSITTGNLGLAAGYFSGGPISTPSTPSGAAYLYARTVSGTTSFYTLNSAGVESPVGGSGYWAPVTYSGQSLLGPTGSTVGIYVPNGSTGASIYNDGSYMRFNFNNVVEMFISSSQSGVDSSFYAFGSLVSYSPNSTTQLALTAANMSTGYDLQILNSNSIGQNTTYMLADPGTTSTNFILSNSSGTQAISTGNLSLSAGYQNYGAISTPSTPAAGNAIIYARTVSGTTDTYTLNSAGVETKISGGTNYWQQGGGIIQPITTGQILQNTGNIYTTNGNMHAGNGGAGNSGNLASYANDGSSLFFISAPNATPFSNILTNASTAQASNWVLPDPHTLSPMNILISDSAGTIVRTSSANGGPLLPNTSAPVTVNFTAFTTSIDSVATSIKETTSGAPITVKETARTTSSVTFEIYNVSASTSTGTVTVYATVTGH